MKQDPRVTLLTQKHMSAGKARNYGIDNAKGEFIHFLDADDYVLDYGYESVLEKARINHLDCVRFIGMSYDEYSIKYYNDLLPGISEIDFERKLCFKTDPQILPLNVAAWTGIYRRSFLNDYKIRFNDLYCVNDRSFFHESLIKCQSMMITKDRVVVHRINTGNSLTSTRAMHFDCQYKSIKRIERILLHDSLKPYLFEVLLSFEFSDLLYWFKLFYQSNNNRECVDRITNEILSEFVSKYSFLNKYLTLYEEIKTEPNNSDSVKKANVILVCFEKCRNPDYSVIIPVNDRDKLTEISFYLTSLQNQKMEFIYLYDHLSDSSLAAIKQFSILDKRFILHKYSGTDISKKLENQMALSPFILLFDKKTLSFCSFRLNYKKMSISSFFRINKMKKAYGFKQ